MRNLVRRYVTQEQRKAENEGVTEDDVNEIKNDISAFRYGIKQKQKILQLFLVTRTTVCKHVQFYLEDTLLIFLDSGKIYLLKF